MLWILIRFKICCQIKGLTHSHKNTFWRPRETSLLKTLWEKKKLLVTSNFSFFHNVFYSIKGRNYHFCCIQFVVCKCFQFGLVPILSYGKDKEDVWNISITWFHKSVLIPDYDGMPYYTVQNRICIYNYWTLYLTCQFLGSSNSAANKDIISKVLTKGDTIFWLSWKWCRKRKNWSLRAISSFPAMFQKLSGVDALKWVSMG